MSNAEHILRECNAHAQGTYMATLAEMAAYTLSGRAYELAIAAVKMMQEWVANPQATDPEAVYSRVGDDDSESGLIFVEQELVEDSPEDIAALCVISALMYVSHLAFTLSGLTHRHSPLDNVDDSTFLDAERYAQGMRLYDHVYAKAVADQLLEHCKVDDGDDR